LIGNIWSKIGNNERTYFFVGKARKYGRMEETKRQYKSERQTHEEQLTNV
jgi:hypothetical protein